jgi:cytochrome d ubiquinol oxidase subunit I
MVALGFAFLLLFGLALRYSIKGNLGEKRWLLRWALWFIPMPWVAAELGWIVAEYGRQPWSIYGVLPTHVSVSNLTPASIYASLAGFIGFYTLLLIVEMYLMVKYARLGPSSIGTSNYHHESALGSGRL